MTLGERATHLAIGIGLGVLFCAGVAAWRAVQPPRLATLAPPAAKVAGIPTETVPCTTVRALAAPAKNKLNLPAAVRHDDQASVLAAADVPRTDDPLIATALLHRDTGLGEIYFTPQPRPWLDLDPPRRWTFDVGYGLKLKRGNSDGTGYFGATYLPARVKRVALGGVLHVYTDRDAFAGVDLRF